MSLSKDKDNETIIASSPTPKKARGLLDAISEIQQYYVVEKSGSTISADFLTYKGKIEFGIIGFKASMMSGLVLGIFAPIAIGVVEQHIPIFGSYEPSTFDQLFALVLAMSFTMGYAAFASTVGRFFVGEITRTAIKNLMGGLVAGKAVVIVVTFIAFHFLYLSFDSIRMADFLLFFGSVLSEDAMAEGHAWWMGFRPSFLVAAWFVVVTTILFLAVPGTALLVKSRKTRRMMQWAEKWK